MREERDRAPERTGPRRETIGLALIALVIVLSLLIAALIALPAWGRLDDPVATATPTPEAVGLLVEPGWS